MKINLENIEYLIGKIDKLIDVVNNELEAYKNAIQAVSKKHRKSAKNLIQYQALRTVDIRQLQKKLGNLGISRLARSEGHVMASLLGDQYILKLLAGDKKAKPPQTNISIKQGPKLLASNTKNLLGFRSKKRRVRIMVTQPTEAAYDYKIIDDLVKRGMNCARINCAHDDPVIWKKTIKNIRKASKAQKRKVQITMDLSGPKIRTGDIIPGPKVRKFRPKRNVLGHILSPAMIHFVDQLPEHSGSNYLPVDKEWIKKLKRKDIIKLVDTSGKNRSLEVITVGKGEAIAVTRDTTYIQTGTMLYPERKNLEPVCVGELPPVKQNIFLKTGDRLIIHKKLSLGEPAKLDHKKNKVSTAHVSCAVPEVFDTVRQDESIFFDDGKIEGIIESVLEDHFSVRITKTNEAGVKLKGEKGINLPKTRLKLSILTQKDKKDLEFAIKHVDLINLSFVNTKEDITEFLECLQSMDPDRKIGLIIKIETRQAYENIIEILLEAMKMDKIGVMIARGDLAIEVGWKNIALVQREILSICHAAHIPVVWATQVLDNLAKKGIPARSEITDATTSLKAECVMLNKGPFINETMTLLDSILIGMEAHREKNVDLFPKMEKILS